MTRVLAWSHGIYIEARERYCTVTRGGAARSGLGLELEETLNATATHDATAVPRKKTGEQVGSARTRLGSPQVARWGVLCDKLAIRVDEDERWDSFHSKLGKEGENELLPLACRFKYWREGLL